MAPQLLILEGDGIGPEVVAEAVKVIERLQAKYGLEVELDYGLVGGIALDKMGMSLPDETLKKAKAAQAVLLGAVGGPKWDNIERALRPEQGLLGLRAGLGLFANLRPVSTYPELAQESTLKPEVIAGLDIMIVRELTGGIYFGQPRGIRQSSGNEREGINTLVYRESEIRRISQIAIDIAKGRSGRLCSVDKANILEVSELWRDVVIQACHDNGGIELSHLYIDNAVMQLICKPLQFDVIVTDNMFGDILSDAAAMLTGSIGMLPSASLGVDKKGMYEPVHGSAPDIAGQGIANPVATILSLAMMLRYSFNRIDLAEKTEMAVRQALADGARTVDLGGRTSTSEIGDKISFLI